MTIFSKTVKTHMLRGQLEVDCLTPPVEVDPELVRQLLLDLLEPRQDEVFCQVVGLTGSALVLQKEDLLLQALLEVQHLRGHVLEEVVGNHAAVDEHRHLLGVELPHEVPQRSWLKLRYHETLQAALTR